MNKTKLEIIEETVEYYSADPIGRRGINSAGSCVYYTNPESKEIPRMCAVGRCLENPKQYDDDGGDVYELADKYSNIGSIDGILKKGYEGHKLEFWNDLQILHDKAEHWNDKGTTEIGKKYIEVLKKKYS